MGEASSNILDQMSSIWAALTYAKATNGLVALLQMKREAGQKGFWSKTKTYVIITQNAILNVQLISTSMS